MLLSISSHWANEASLNCTSCSMKSCHSRQAVCSLEICSLVPTDIAMVILVLGLRWRTLWWGCTSSSSGGIMETASCLVMAPASFSRIMSSWTCLRMGSFRNCARLNAMCHPSLSGYQDNGLGASKGSPSTCAQHSSCPMPFACGSIEKGITMRTKEAPTKVAARQYQQRNANNCTRIKTLEDFACMQPLCHGKDAYVGCKHALC